MGVHAEEQRERVPLSFVHVKFRIHLFAELPTFNKLFLIFSIDLINIAEEVSRAPISDTQGYMLNLPAQQVARNK